MRTAPAVPTTPTALPEPVALDHRRSGGVLAPVPGLLGLLLVLLGPPSATLPSPGPMPAAAPAVRPGAPLAFQGVTVIDVTTGRRLADQTVVIVGNRIAAVGPTPATQVPPGASVVDARGKYLMPGLWDMHAHVTGRPRSGGGNMLPRRNLGERYLA